MLGESCVFSSLLRSWFASWLATDWIYPVDCVGLPPGILVSSGLGILPCGLGKSPRNSALVWVLSSCWERIKREFLEKKALCHPQELFLWFGLVVWAVDPGAHGGSCLPWSLLSHLGKGLLLSSRQAGCFQGNGVQGFVLQWQAWI